MGIMQMLMGGGGPSVFSASGGTKTGPTGGYFYHVFDAGSSSFIIESGEGPIQVAMTGSGSDGGGSGPPGGDEAGAGGGGGGSGAFTIGNMIPGTYPVEVAPAGATTPNSPSYNPGSSGDKSEFVGPPSHAGTLSAYGGAASLWYNNTNGGGVSGSWPSSPSFTTDMSSSGGPGHNGDHRFPHPSRNYGPLDGGVGGNAGHSGNPGWWDPFLNPGAGGQAPCPTITWPTGLSGLGEPGSNYGGGGGGGGRGGGGGGAGAAGRIIVRYPDP